MTREVAIKAIQDFIGWFKEDSLIRKALEMAIQALSQEPCAESEDNVNNLCSSCTNIGCEFQSGIVRTKCAFYMPPHIESDNCGNYVVMKPTAEANNALNMCDDAVSRDEERYNKGFYDGYTRATEQANAVIENIKAEIEGLMSHDDYMVDGFNVLDIIDKHIKRRVKNDKR